MVTAKPGAGCGLLMRVGTAKIPVSIETLMNRSLPPAGLIVVTSTSWKGVTIELDELKAANPKGPKTTSVLDAAVDFCAKPALACASNPNANIPTANSRLIVFTPDIPSPFQRPLDAALAHKCVEIGRRRSVGASGRSQPCSRRASVYRWAARAANDS